MSLEDLKAGDKIALLRTQYSKTTVEGIYEIARTTKTQIVTTNGDRYNRGSGLPIPRPSHRWGPSYRIERAQAKHRDLVAHGNAAARLIRLGRDLIRAKLANATPEQMNAIADQLEAFAAPKATAR